MSYNPERALWQEVLLRHIQDALSGPSNTPNEQHYTHIVESARKFLTKRTKGLDALCLAAGVDTDAVVTAMRNKIADAPSPHDLIAIGKQSNAAMRKKPTTAKRNRESGTAGADGRCEPGVGSNFRRCEGTGAGRSAQDRPNLGFSEHV